MTGRQKPTRNQTKNELPLILPTIAGGEAEEEEDDDEVSAAVSGSARPLQARHAATAIKHRGDRTPA